MKPRTHSAPATVDAAADVVNRCARDFQHRRLNPFRYGEDAKLSFGRPWESPHPRQNDVHLLRFGDTYENFHLCCLRPTIISITEESMCDFA